MLGLLKRLIDKANEREFEVRDLRTGTIVSRGFIRAISMDDAREVAKAAFPAIPSESLSVEEAYLDWYGH